MRHILSLSVLVLLFTSAAAQNIDLKLNAGANLSRLPDFNNRISIVNGFVVPGVISPGNARNPPVVTAASSATSPGVGFYVEAEAGKKLNSKWKLSLALGLMQLRYDYDTHISQSFYKNDFYLSELIGAYGDTKFTYLTLRPINISRTFSRFSLQAGPVLNYLVSKKNTNVVTLYNTATGEAVGAFFEQKGDAQKLLYGANLNLRCEVVRSLAVMLGAQYFFNSLYEKENTYKPLRDKSKPLQLQLGLSYNFAPLFHK